MYQIFYNTSFYKNIYFYIVFLIANVTFDFLEYKYEKRFIVLSGFLINLSISGFLSSTFCVEQQNHNIEQNQFNIKIPDAVINFQRNPVTIERVNTKNYYFDAYNFKERNHVLYNASNKRLEFIQNNLMKYL